MGSGTERAWLRLALIGATVSVLIAAAGPAAASVTIGQIAAPSGCVSGYDDIPRTVPTGNSYVVPGTGAITSWTTWAGSTGGEMKMKIYRKVGDPDQYEVVGHDRRGLVGGGTAGNTFAVNIPVKAGDVLGFSLPGPNGGCIFTATGDYFYRNGDLGDGMWDAFTNVASDARPDIQAVFTPSESSATNTFSSFLKGKKLLVRVQASGKVSVSDAASPLSASTAKKKRQLLLKTSSASGDPPTITVPLRFSKLAKQRLRQKGKLKVRARITFTPQGGLAATQTAKLKIKGKTKKK